MLTARTLRLAAALPFLVATAARAQQTVADAGAATPDSTGAPSAASDTTAPNAKASESRRTGLVPIEISHYRAPDQRGINVFEPPKAEGVPYTGFKLAWGAAFTQQFQNLHHENTAAERPVNGVNANQLMSIGGGFNNAVANIYLNAQLAKGVRVALTTYASARHHQETWVKDGYVLIDDSPIDVPVLNTLMKYVTLRAGHFELNYGDAHFRRTDNGQGIYNPFVGNYIMDQFTTEIGGEVYVRSGPWMVMGGVTGGEVRGQVTAPDKRAPSYLGKVGYDQQLTKDLRVRLTGSTYSTASSVSNTLYSGDRAGSRYYMVMENTAATEKDQAWSGSIQPGFKSSVRAYVINPFVKYRGLELFGNVEQAKGKAATETADRSFKQYAGEAVYRFLASERLYVGSRYNTVKGQLSGMANDVSVDRWEFGGGWFVTPNVLAKAEWVTQKYNDFPTTDIRNGGRFRGLMLEGTVAF
jgi:hypothetical protein